MAQQTRTGDDADPYTIRRYRPGDRADVVDLYEQVFGGPGEAWFSWKYENNPYVDHVPMTVGTYEGTVVATKPCLALQLRAGESTVLALQPADVMVHPDHRRNGLYSRTTELIKEVYADREPALFFNFPNAATLSGSLKHGWEIVTEVPTYYRVHRPATMLDAEDGPALTLARSLTPLARGYLGVRDAVGSGPASVTVERHADVPVDTLVAAYRRDRPDALHALRDSRYYSWRFENPRWNYETYTAGHDRTAVGGMIVGTREADGRRIAAITDVVPLAGGDSRRETFAALLRRIVDDHADAGTIAIGGGVVPRDLLSAFGFLGDDAFPLARFASPTTQVTYSLTDDPGHRAAGFDLADPQSWSLSLSEQDTW
jgi:hypothetical protein